MTFFQHSEAQLEIIPSLAWKRDCNRNYDKTYFNPRRCASHEGSKDQRKQQSSLSSLCLGVSGSFISRKIRSFKISQIYFAKFIGVKAKLELYHLAWCLFGIGQVWKVRCKNCKILRLESLPPFFLTSHPIKLFSIMYLKKNTRITF